MAALASAVEVCAQTDAAAMASGPAAQMTENAKPKGPELSFYGLESGRFEVVTLAGAEGAELGELAELAWDVWRGPFGLPDRWPVGITVRLAPAENWGGGAASFRVVAEPGGVVSVWIRARAAGESGGLTERRRFLGALAAGALHRQAIFIGVTPERIATPAWLSAAAAEAVLIRQQPALGDGWQREVANLATVPALRTILDWGDTDALWATDVRAAAFGVWGWLQAEGARSGAWRRFLAEVIGGGDGLSALSRNYPDQPGRGSRQELELAWQTACASLVRVKNVPVLEPEETRRWLEQIDRILLADPSAKGGDEAGGGAERALELADLWARRKEPVVRAQLAERSALLAANFRQIHPFYRNAAGSLGRAWLALEQGKRAEWRRAREELRQDRTGGRTLEEASRRILDGDK